jgi:protein-S-isoprenylcysteine O-methyltransferase Ste14
MWSSAPKVKAGHELRTDGPYAVTRHPIYSGMLGMMLGTSLAAGLGLFTILVPLGLVIFLFKIRTEERLMTAEFPQDYPQYRERVPQLIPGLHRRRR